jgi:putative heme-binding domain-containing protein
LRAIALRSVARQYDLEVVDGLVARMLQESDRNRIGEYADCLARVEKKPAAWTYWGYRPPPRPANSVPWERTAAIHSALNGMLSHSDFAVRQAVLRSMQREKTPASVEALRKWLSQERDAERVAAILDAVREHKGPGLHQELESLIRSTGHTLANRLVALTLWVDGYEKQQHENQQLDGLLALAHDLEDGPVLVEVLRHISLHPKIPATSLLAGKLRSTDPEIRAAALKALGERRDEEGREALVGLLADPDARVRRVAAEMAGKLSQRRAIEPLLALARSGDPLVRVASLEALRLLDEPRAVPLAVAALDDLHSVQAALHVLRDLGGPEQSSPVAELMERNPSLDVLLLGVQTLTAWQTQPETTTDQREEIDRFVARIQGAKGSLLRWHVAHRTDPLPDTSEIPSEVSDERIQFATGPEGRITSAEKEAKKGSWLHAWTEVTVAASTQVEFFGSGHGGMRVWLNGTPIHRQKDSQRFRVDSDRFTATLGSGENRLVVAAEVGPAGSPAEFHLRLRPKSAVAEHERLLEAVLGQSGNLQHGRQVLINLEKSLCLKCHRLNEQGERIGPELTGLGSRFSRVYIAESILEPSRTIAPSFGALVVSLDNGQILTGVKVDESESMLTLADQQGVRHVVPKSTIEEQHASPLSAMPVGLEKRLTEEEFVDLVAYLASLKKN